MPGMVKTFLEDLHIMEPRVQRVHLQTIPKAAYVNRDMIGLELRI